MRRSWVVSFLAVCVCVVLFPSVGRSQSEPPLPASSVIPIAGQTSEGVAAQSLPTVSGGSTDTVASAFGGVSVRVVTLTTAVWW